MRTGRNEKRMILSAVKYGQIPCYRYHDPEGVATASLVRKGLMVDVSSVGAQGGRSGYRLTNDGVELAEALAAVGYNLRNNGSHLYKGALPQ